MDEPKTILTVYIGDTDIYEWTMGIGKTVLMPELLVGCEEVLYNDTDEVKCARVEAIIRGKPKAFDFNVTYEGVEDTLEKIMSWSLQEEHYEMCQRVQNLQQYLENQNQF
jgi:hypothetical protein